MDEQTRQALEASIKHWEENLAAETPDAASVHASDCALCNLFAAEFCTGCPVAERTGTDCCEDTPYHGAAISFDDWNHYGHRLYRDKWRDAAQDELDFLKSLRDGGR